MSNKKEEDNKLDLKIRSLMENAEEPVPEHLWTAISDRLDAAEALAHKRLVIPVWFRRAAIGLAAAAAVALGVFLFVPRHHATDGGRVAVVSPTEENDVTSVTENRPVVAEQEGPESQSAEDQPSLASQIASAPSYIARTLETPGEEIPSDTAQNASDTAGKAAESDEYMISETESEEASITEPSESPVSSSDEYSIAESSGSAAASSESKADDTFSADRPGDMSSWSGDGTEENGASSGRRKVRTAIVMSGNAMGNGSTSSSASSGTNRQLSSSIVQQTTPGISQNSNSDSNFSIPASFGLGVKIIFTPRWSLGVGVNYSILSRTFAGTYTASTDDTPKSYSKIRHNVSYIGIPVNAYFSIVSSHAVDFYCYAGGSVEKAVGNRYVLEDDGIYKEGVRGVQCSADLGIGVEFTIVDMVGLYIDPSIRYYFPNSHQPTSIRTQEPFTFGFEIGFRIRL